MFGSRTALSIDALLWLSSSPSGGVSLLQGVLAGDLVPILLATEPSRGLEGRTVDYAHLIDAVTWLSGFVGTASPQELGEEVVKAVETVVDEFSNQYLRVQPPAAQHSNGRR